MERKQRKIELNQVVNIDVQPGNGTRYDLLLINDPNGGVLICWSIMGWMYRYYPYEPGVESEIKQLGRKGCINQFDLEAIHRIMDNWFDGVKQ